MNNAFCTWAVASVLITSMPSRLYAEDIAVDSIAEAISRLALQSRGATTATDVATVVKEITINSKWWLDRNPPRSDGFANYFGSRNSKITFLDISFGAETKDPPVEDSSELTRFSNCLEEKTVRKEVAVKREAVVGVSVTDSVTTEQDLKLDIGTNAAASTFLSANLSLSQKLTVNLTTVKTTQETSTVVETWTEDIRIKKEFLTVILARKHFEVRNLPFEATVLIDAEVQIDFFVPQADNATRRQTGWRPLTLFAPLPSQRTRKIKGKIYSGTTKITDIIYTGKPIDPNVDPVCKIQ